MRNRLVSALLALCMVLTLLPAQAMALEMDSDGMEFLPLVVEDEESEASEEAELPEEVEQGRESQDELYTEPVVSAEPSVLAAQSRTVLYPATEGTGYIHFNTETGTVTGCDSGVWRAEIPSTIEGVTVKSIGTGAFMNCSGLGGIIIPNSVTSIGDSAFEECWSLESIIIPDSVISIGERAFWGCQDMTSVTISRNITSIGANTIKGSQNPRR